MATFTIHDKKDHVLAFDLRDLIRIFAPSSLAATWTILTPNESHFEARGAGAGRLEKLAKASAQIDGDELLAIANDLVQVIWGDFQGALPDDPDRTWMIIRAFDSSLFEVQTSDEACIAAIKARFRDVRVAEGTN